MTGAVTRVSRVGSFYGPPGNTRSARRFDPRPSFAFRGLGLRPAMGITSD